jgi:hypothetical protein
MRPCTDSAGSADREPSEAPDQVPSQRALLHFMRATACASHARPPLSQQTVALRGTALPLSSGNARACRGRPRGR